MKTLLVCTAVCLSVIADSSQLAAQQRNETAGRIIHTLDSLRRKGKAATADSMKSMLVLIAQFQLSRLGYATKFTAEDDSSFRNAVAQYQAAKGLSPSGELGPATLDTLTAEADMLSASETPRQRLKTFNAYRWTAGHIEAEGDWQAANYSAAKTFLGAKLRCTKSTGVCDLILVSNNSLSLDISVDAYEIVSWDDKEIVATLDVECARYEMVVSRNQKTVESTRRRTSTQGPCKALDSKTLVNELTEPKLLPPPPLRFVGKARDVIKMWN